MNEITTTRHNPLVDPVLHVWRAEIPLYLFLGGLAAGLMVLAGVARLRGGERSRVMALLAWAAPVLLSVGMFALWLDLENRWNVIRFYLALRPTSPMSWGSWILLLVYPASIAIALLETPTDLREAVLSRTALGRRLLARLETCPVARVRALAWANVIIGAALGVYTGVLLGTMSARPLWNSAILGPLFLASGVSSAAAFLLLFPVRDDERLATGRFDARIMVVEAILIALWLVGLATGGADARAAAGLVLGGPYTTAFWMLVVTLGIATPFTAELIEARHRIVPGRVAAALVLIGGFALRWIVVFAGQESTVAQTALR